MAEMKVNYICTCTTIKNKLNIRKSANSKADIVSKIDPGTKNISVTKVNGEWFYCDKFGGWGYSTYLKITNRKLPVDATNSILQNAINSANNFAEDFAKGLTNKPNKTIPKNEMPSAIGDLELDPTTKSKKTGLEGTVPLAKSLEKDIINIKHAIIDHGLAYSPASAEWHTKFSRINMLDPYNTLIGNTKEYLFFVKPDLNIISVAEKTKGNLIGSFNNNPFFMDLAVNSPNVIYGLQYSARHKPFVSYLSGMVRSNLQVQNIEADTVETASNIYGTSIEYRGDGHKSNENIQFGLEFGDNQELETYLYFKAYEKYEEAKKKGLAGPKYSIYRTAKVLHDTMGIYKFIVGEDMETIVYYAYICGAIPLTVPRDAFSEIEPGKVISYNIDFKAAFIEDMEPIILRDFNILADEQLGSESNLEIIPTYDKINRRFNGEWAKGAKVKVVKLANGKHVYKLIWYKDKPKK